jgi:hypothetical protein
MPSKVAFDPEEPSLGRIPADSIAPSHSPISIKRCISRVERNPGLAHADLFADTLCDTPLIEGHISILPTDGTGLSPNDPMAIVQVERGPVRVPVPVASIPVGRYVIKNRAADVYWWARSPTPNISVLMINFNNETMEDAKMYSFLQVSEHFP